MEVTPTGGGLVLGAGGVAGAAVEELEAAEEVHDFRASLTGSNEGVSGAVGTLLPTEPLDAGIAKRFVVVFVVVAAGGISSVSAPCV